MCNTTSPSSTTSTSPKSTSTTRTAPQQQHMLEQGTYSGSNGPNNRKAQPTQQEQQQPQRQFVDHTESIDAPFSVSSLTVASLSRHLQRFWTMVEAFISTRQRYNNIPFRVLLSNLRTDVVARYRYYHHAPSKRKWQLSLLALGCFVLSITSIWRSTSTVYYSDNDDVNNGVRPRHHFQQHQQQQQQQQQQPSQRNESEMLIPPLLPPVSTYRRGRVVFCGWARHRQLFPDYEKPILWRKEYIPYFTSQDILLYSRNQHKSKDLPCDGFKSANPQDLLDVFPGKILYVNGESYPVALQKLRPLHVRTNRIFQIGAFPRHGSHPSQRQHWQQQWSTQQQSTSSSAPPPPPPPLSLREAVVANYTMAVTYMALYHMPRLVHPKEGFSPALMDFTGASRPINTNLYRNGVAYFTSKCIQYRQEAATNISSILTVHYGDGCPVEPSKVVVNVNSQQGGGVFHVANQTREDFKENYILYNDYPFCLVMENKEHPGYVTEKIFNAYMGGCLPIYYGTKEIFNIFHPESFIFYDVHNPQPALDLLQQLRDDSNEYDRRLKRTPMLRDGSNSVEEYFSILPSIGNGTLNCQMRAMMGLPPLPKNRKRACARGGMWVPSPPRLKRENATHIIGNKTKTRKKKKKKYVTLETLMVRTGTNVTDGKDTTRNETGGSDQKTPNQLTTAKTRKTMFTSTKAKSLEIARRAAARSSSHGRVGNETATSPKKQADAITAAAGTTTTTSAIDTEEESKRLNDAYLQAARKLDLATAMLANRSVGGAPFDAT